MSEPKSKSEIVSENLERMIYEFLEKYTNISIQCFVTMKDSNKIFPITYGNGDWYSRVGYIREWLMEQDEKVRENARQSMKQTDREEEF